LDVSYNPHLDVSFVGLNGDSTTLRHLEMRQTGTTSVTGVSKASKTLEVANLSENKLDTQFPLDLFELTKLTSLHVAECSLKGSLPDDIHRLSMLHELNLYKNDLTGTLPEGLSRLVHMRHLTVSFNQFHGTLPSYLNDKMIVLQQFWAANNDFTGAIPSFSVSPDIFKLYLNGNSFSGDIPDDFLEATLGGPNSNPISINLSHNEFEGIIPESLDRLEALEIHWKLGDNKWTAVPDVLCDNANWNDGNVAEFGCFGLLCPPRMYSRVGYQTEEMKCQPCETAEYFGATNCFDKDDRSALVELFVATNGEKWDRNDGWLEPETSVCDWYGIYCWDIGDIRDGRVRRVELPNNNLQGEIPETLLTIEHMTTLDVSRNPVTVYFTNMHRTQHLFSVNVAGTNTKDYDGIEHANSFFKRLYADQTPVGGTIPKEIRQMENLQVLSMQECDLNGELPANLFDNMVSLKELYLANNNLKGAVPDRWDALEDLEILSLAKNQFKGGIPSSLDAAPSLTSVSLQDQLSKGGGLTGSLPAFASTRTLSQLMVGNNKLDGDLPEDFLAAVEEDTLFTIDLSNNKFTGTVHGSWDRFQNMNLYLEGNRIAEIDQGLCSNAEWMSGGVGSFGCDAILCPAGTMGGRRQFTDIGCEVCRAVNTEGSYLGQVNCGESEAVLTGEQGILELFYNRMGGNGWRSSENWMTDTTICAWYGVDCNEDGSVASIQLGSNQLVGSFPTEIFQLPNLVHLKLHDNDIQMSFLGIENARNLETLSLDSTGLESLNGVGQARSLVELNVGHNKLKDLPEELSRLINLRTLDVSHNLLGGFLPYWMPGLVSLTTFTASNNQFSGPVSDFSSFSNLVYVDLSANQLTGSVPSTLLGGAPDDEKVVIDLSSNMINGVVPAELGRLSRLSLQLQDNRITEIDSDLCNVEGINDYDVMSFGCDAILCPAGTWNNIGRQSNEDMPCEPCSKAKFMGSTHCGKSSAPKTLATSLGLLLGAVITWIVV